METERKHGPGCQAYGLLRFSFVVAPILAGLDKFFSKLTTWEQYLSPMALKVLGDQAHAFMMAVGVIEIIVGIGVIWKPRVFSYIVAIWLALIIVNLIMLGNFYDIALRDLGLFLAALALGRLSSVYAKR